MAFTTTNLSLYHSFSKMPAQNSTTLGNAINKSGHTVAASEVWAQDIPYYGKMGSLEDVKSKVQPYARKNDMCYITAGDDKGKTFQYDGDGNWTDITATLVDGALIKNANDDVVLLYHKGQTLTNLTADNNANTDSANNAARLWAKRDTEGVTIPNSGTRLIEQFVAPTDKALNGLASVAYAPVIANGTLISGTNYYDYCFSGTILWATARTAATLIDCFEYVGDKISDVVDTVSTQGTTLQTVKDQVDTISDALGLGSEIVGTTLGSRVTDNEAALRVLLGLEDDAKVVATDSISNIAAGATADANAYTDEKIETELDSENGSIGQAIEAAKNAAIADAKISISSGTGISVSPEGEGKSFTISVTDDIATIEDLTALTETISSVEIDLTNVTNGLDGRLTTAEAQIAELTSGENSVESQINAISEKSLEASSGDTSSLIVVETTGTVGGGMGISVDDTALAKAIEDAESNAVGAAKSLILDAEDSSETTEETDAKVTVKLSGTVETHTLTVTTANIASQASVQALSDRVTALHQTPQFKVAIVTKPEGGFGEGGWQAAVEDGLVENTIYLVPDDVLSDVYVEYVAYKSGEVIVTERIGTTKTDLKDYSTTEQMNSAITGAIEGLDVTATTQNGITYSQTDGKVSISIDAIEAITDSTTTTEDKLVTAGAVKSAVDTLNDAISSKVAEVTGGSNGITITTAEKDADGKVVATLAVSTATLVENDAIVESIASGDEEKFVTAAQILEAIKLAKPENYVASVTGYTATGEEVTTTQGAAIKVLDGRGTSVTANDIWGTTATMDASGVVTIAHDWITANGPWNNSITSVEENKAYIGDTEWANIQTDMINDGREMFAECSSLSTFSSKLSSLTHARGMFKNCSQLESFEDNLSTLIDAEEMFRGCSNLSYFDSDLFSLVNGISMFASCNNLSSFEKDLPNLKWGNTMFVNCPKLETFSSDISSLMNGDGMFQFCHKLGSFYSDLPSMTGGVGMFYGTALSSFTYDLSSLRDGKSMFEMCQELKTFTSELPSLTNGEGMFRYCNKLESFSSDLSSLKNGGDMFDDCNKLTSFSSDLSSLTNGGNMFDGCYDLVSFCGDLSSLTNGINMFAGCSLDTESVEIIADTINDVTGLELSDEITKIIDIKIGNDTPNDEEDTAFKQMQDKGWNVFVNGSQTEYVPRTGEASLDETGETPVAPKPYWAKPIEVTEDKAEYVGQDGKFYQVVGGQFIYVTDPETYGMFVSLEDAVANMRLTKYVKPVEEETVAQA